MTLMSRLIARYMKLPRAETSAVDVEKHMAIPMPDGVVLRADHLLIVHVLDVEALTPLWYCSLVGVTTPYHGPYKGSTSSGRMAC
jgi:hypothetical protein